MEILFLIGRLLFGGFFLMMGINHFMKTEMIADMARARDIPAAKGAVYLSGLLLFFGGLGVILGIYEDMALWFLIIFLVPAAFLMHPYWKEKDQNQKMIQMLFFLRNVALTGAALMLLYLVNWPLTL